MPQLDQRVLRQIMPKRPLASRLRALADPHHWRYKQWGQQWRIFPSQITRLIYGLPTIQLTDIADADVPTDPPILDDLCLPNHAAGPGHNDLRPLLKILKSRSPRLVLEFGTAHGNTTANICRQCPEAHVVTVNALPGQITGEVITFALTEEEIGRVYRAYGYSEQVRQIFSNTLQVDLKEHLAESSVDLAIIDACHDTPFVVSDFLKVQAFMKPGGLVLLHDTHPSMEDHLVGSYRACMALRRCGHDIRHLQDTWWGVWQKPGKRS